VLVYLKEKEVTEAICAYLQQKGYQANAETMLVTLGLGAKGIDWNVAEPLNEIVVYIPGDPYLLPRRRSPNRRRENGR